MITGAETQRRAMRTQRQRKVSDAAAARQLRVTRLTRTIYVGDRPQPAVRGWFLAGGRAQFCRCASFRGCRRILRHLVAAGTATARRRTHRREHRRPGNARSIVIRGLLRLAYLVGRVSTSVTATRRFGLRSRH